MINTLQFHQKVWLITGTSSGFGKRLVRSALARGDYVIATVRTFDPCSLPEGDRSRLRIIKLDVADSAENIQRAMDEALSIWGRVDVLVNNAGYGAKSLIEEGGCEVAMKQFQTNLFGVINVTNAILPHMRERKSGTVVMIGSRSAWKADMPTAGIYIASKAALHALGESYAAELAQFNVRVMVCAPGAFRTENVHNVPYSSTQHIPAYDALRERSLAGFSAVAKQARGDPDKAMEVLVDVVRGEGRAKGREMPMYLLLGNITYTHARAYCQRLLKEMDYWEDVAKDLDFDPEE
ncbi:NAD-P-binding protein [Laetiporus sulphureus 93-53]|uniref:NAD-P-binding protein n=1 Tax=Laetiporus sulphureus 93-53 TaxID=1314785 RepID=A0A165E8I9_9APHY|nr:NAD-P-binding protein [Laetiporus sulphureus 93-53]KZT06464.1 NAD-P-binding protein [Laetiporus sulphureus 93-53]